MKEFSLHPSTLNLSNQLQMRATREVRSVDAKTRLSRSLDGLTRGERIAITLRGKNCYCLPGRAGGFSVIGY